jgi:hypothetical protein
VSGGIVNVDALAEAPGTTTRRGRGFKSLLLHTSVFRVLEMSENRSKSARVRAIRDRARTQRERLFQPDSPKSANSPLSAIYLGPRIIALDSL